MDVPKKKMWPQPHYTNWNWEGGLGAIETAFCIPLLKRRKKKTFYYLNLKLPQDNHRLKTGFKRYHNLMKIFHQQWWVTHTGRCPKWNQNTLGYLWKGPHKGEVGFCLTEEEVDQKSNSVVIWGPHAELDCAGEYLVLQSLKNGKWRGINV